MFAGSVTFKAEITGNGAEIPLIDFTPPISGVDHIEIEVRDKTHVFCVCHFNAVDTIPNAVAAALAATNLALNRLAYIGIVAEKERIDSHQFVDQNNPNTDLSIRISEYIKVTDKTCVTVAKSPAFLKTRLEDPAIKGEKHFGLFRSALLSHSPVERFMHLYNLLLMLFSDKQKDVDAFIVQEDSKVPMSQHPMQKAGVQETLYTRLRNEFAHVRPGVKIEDTKAGMEDHWCNLRDLTLKAIEQHPWTGLRQLQRKSQNIDGVLIRTCESRRWPYPKSECPWK